MNVTIKGSKITITMDFDAKGSLSSTGKSLVHASTHGNKPTEVEVNGVTLVLGLNAYTKVAG